MGRLKIKIQPLPESQIKAKFKKRKSGLVKKAYELGTLCGAQIALIIFSKDGEEVIHKGYNATILEIVERYRTQVHCRDRSVLPQRGQIPALQVPHFQPNFDSNSQQGIAMDPRGQQEVVIMDPNMQYNQYAMNPQVQQDQYVNMNLQEQQDQYNGMNPQEQQDQYGGMNPQAHQDQFMNPQAQQDQFMNSQAQQDQYGMNPQDQQDQFVNPQAQQDQFMNSHTQQEAPTGPRMQQDQFMNPHKHQSMTGFSPMQQVMPYTITRENFVDHNSSNYMQDMVGGHQQFHAQGPHQTPFENRSNVRYHRQPSEVPGYQN